jgi:hypothetical protein
LLICLSVAHKNWLMRSAGFGHDESLNAVFPV